jgi:hypothetical protein
MAVMQDKTKIEATGDAMPGEYKPFFNIEA